MRKHHDSKGTAFALESADLCPASRGTVGGCATAIAGPGSCPSASGERSGDQESGKLLKCADGSFLTKHVKRPSSRTCL